jgi:hypothetical protein
MAFLTRMIFTLVVRLLLHILNRGTDTAAGN